MEKIEITLNQLRTCFLLSAAMALDLKSNNILASNTEIIEALKDEWNKDSELSEMLEVTQDYKPSKTGE